MFSQLLLLVKEIKRQLENETVLFCRMKKKVNNRHESATGVRSAHKGKMFVVVAYVLHVLCDNC